MQTIKMLFCVLMALTILTGCQNTIQGFGKDMQQTGREIQKSTD